MTKLIKKRPFSVLFTLLCLVALGHLCSILPQDDAGDYGDSPLFGQSLRQSLARLSGVAVARADDDDKDSGPDNSTQGDDCVTQSGDDCNDPPPDPPPEPTKSGTTCNGGVDCCVDGCGNDQDCIDQCNCPTDDGSGGDGSGENGSVHVRINLGKANTRSLFNVGYLQLFAMKPRRDLADPDYLNLVSVYEARIIGNIEDLPEIYKQTEESIENDDVIYIKIENDDVVGFHFEPGSYIGRPLLQQDTWRLYRMDEEGTYNTTNTAYYDLHYIGKQCGESSYYYRFSATTLDLLYIYDRQGRQIKAADAGLDVIRSTYGEMEQIAAPQCLADIVVSNDACYQIRFYTRTQAGEKNADGFYYPSGSPYAVWTIENPDAATNGYERLLVRKEAGPETNQYFYTWVETNSEWVMTRPGTPYEESVVREWNEDRSLLTETRTITVSNETCYVQQKQVARYPWGLQTVSEVTDPDGIALTEQQTFYDDANQVGRYSRLASVMNPDGFWERYDYNTNGARTTVVSPWKDSATNAPDADCRIVTLSYESHELADVVGAYDYRPRTKTARVQGQIVKKEFYVYKKVDGEEIIIFEQAVSPSANYGDTGNLRTIRTYYGAVAGDVICGRLKSTINPNGTMISYTYELGDYTGGSTNPGVFTVGCGEYLRETIVYGCTNSPQGLAYQTTRDVRIRNAVDSVVLQETQVYTGSSYEQVGWSVYNYDGIGRRTNKWLSNGLCEEQTWSGFQKSVYTDNEGIEKTYTYDEFGKRASETRLGVAASGEYPAVPDLTIAYNRDPLGRVVGQTRSGGVLSQVSSNVYDMAGRIICSVDVHGLTTTWAYAEGGRIIAKTLPGGATEVTTKYRDGRLCSVTGTAVVARFYDYGANTDGTQWEVIYTGATSSPQWERKVYDMLGRKIRIEKPAFGGGVVTNTFEYDSCGFLVKTTTPGVVPALYEYDVMGKLIRQGLDVDSSGTLDPISNDRVEDREYHYILDEGSWYSLSLEKIYTEDLSDFCVTQFVSLVEMSGVGCACQAVRTVKENVHGNVSEMVVDVDRENKRVTRTVISSLSTNLAVQVSVNGLIFSSESKTGVKLQYHYDALERLIQEINSRMGTNIINYNENGYINYIKEASGNRISYDYSYQTGYRISEIDHYTNTKHTAYNLRGGVVGIWGATYPVLYDYDDAGRMVAMYTLRDDAINTNTSYDGFRSQIASFDKTTWQYDVATGLLTNKLYANNIGTAYSYSSDGRLATRAWARGITTYYSYDLVGNLTNLSYSDEMTPSISYTYGRWGNKKTVSDVLGTRTLTYNDAIQLICDSNANGVVGYNIDALGRLAGVSLGADDYAVTYKYDDFGRFIAVTSSMTGTFQYHYVPDSDLIEGLSNGNFSVNFMYEPYRPLKTSVKNSYSNELISEYFYIYDALGRRTAVQNRGQAFTLVTNAFNLYDYNARSELVGAARYLGASTADTTRPITNEMYNYSYDPIGNRQEASEEGLSLETYTANELNQYALITSALDQVTLSYDLDGNLTNDGQKAYTWNGENRLVKIEPLVLTNGSWMIENAYDYMGRRVRKRVYNRDSGAWVLESKHDYLYDKWNLIEETRVSSSTQVCNYVWGLDFSGTLRGAGGVGGLLASIKPKILFYAFDANGNVGQLIDHNGLIDAHYEYNPYGHLAYSFGSNTNNVYKFSTKYLDEKPTLYYYGYRFLNTLMGRWLNRDPLVNYDAGSLQEGFDSYILKTWYSGDTSESKVSQNLYRFLNNSSINRYDFLGLAANDPPNTVSCPACDGQPYNPDTQCCEYWTVVSKVPIWICKGRLGGDDSPIPIMGPISHSYVACQDPAKTPNPDRYGKHPRPFGQPGNKFKGPGYINSEIGRDPAKADCEKKMVCPAEKKEKCKGEGPSARPYCMVGPNCHRWAK